MKKKLCIFIIVLIAILIPVIFINSTAHAYQPTFEIFFDDLDEMLECFRRHSEGYLNSLNRYHRNFSNRLPFNAGMSTFVGLQQVIIPEVSGYTLIECSYYPHSYLHFKFSDGESDIRITTHFRQTQHIMQRIIERNFENEFKVVVYNDKEYYVNIWNNHNFFFFVDNIIIGVVDSEPFSEERVNLIQFQETDILFPVVRVRISENENNIHPGILIAAGGALIFVGVFVYIFIALRKKRRRDDEH